jgi:hypothetical protein
MNYPGLGDILKCGESFHCVEVIDLKISLLVSLNRLLLTFFSTGFQSRVVTTPIAFLALHATSDRREQRHEEHHWGEKNHAEYERNGQSFIDF